MSYPAPYTSSVQSTEKIRQCAIRGESKRQSTLRTLSIHILDDDSLLNVFYLYRQAILLDEEDEISSIMGATGWQWWYKLTHVCRRWRNVILGSASYLRLCLVCTYRTPVADMLAHSPPLPLVIDYFKSSPRITAEIEEGMIVALGLRDRVRSIRFRFPMGLHSLRNLIMAMDGEYPILEYLMLDSTFWKNARLHETLQAPHLRHLVLRRFCLPKGSRLLTTAAGLVTLTLTIDNPYPNFQPNILPQWLSLMPQLEMLQIVTAYQYATVDPLRQLMHTPATTIVTLPNLRCLKFSCFSAYIDAVIRRITAPRLENLGIGFNDLKFYIPSLFQFMTTSENLKFDSAKFKIFNNKILVEAYLCEVAEVFPLLITGNCHGNFIRLASSIVKFFSSLSQMSQIFSTVENLTLEREESFGEHEEVDRTEWRNLLRLFRNVKTLGVDDVFVQELSRCLRVDDGELPMELLPELQELAYPGSGDSDDAFVSFIDARQNAGRPVTLVRL